MAIVSAKDQLVALYNASNSGLAQALGAGDVDFGPVTALVGGTEGRESKVTITAKAESEHFMGSLVLEYIRLAPGVVGNKAVTADLTDWDTDEEVLAFVNADVIAAGKTEDAFAAAELEIVRADGEEGVKLITVNIVAGHLKYNAGVLAVYTVTQEIVKTDLSTTNGELDGFTI